MPQEEINWCFDEPRQVRARAIADASEMMSVDYINKSFGIDFADALILGADKEYLHQRLAEKLNKPEDSPEVEVARMNLVAGLRSWGYHVEGGRAGRSVPYRIVGWAPLKEKKDVSIWGGETYSWVRSLTKVVPEDAEKTRAIMASPLSCDPRRIHERSWLYLWCYELARDTGFWYVDPENRGIAIIIQKHENYPRYRIFNLTLDSVGVMNLARKLAPISLQAVRVLCVHPDVALTFRREDPNGFISKRRQAIYRVDRVALAYDNGILNKRAREMFRANERNISWDQDVVHYYRMKTVIDTWKEFNEKKHRQLAITRDYQALEYSWTGTGWDDQRTLRFLGMRDQLPSCIHILDPIVVRTSGVAQIVEKSLNYSDIPGGKPGTADFNLIKTCQWLQKRGVEWINAGGYDGGGWGLPQHKSIFALEGEDIYSYTYDFSFPWVKKEDIQIA